MGVGSGKPLDLSFKGEPSDSSAPPAESSATGLAPLKASLEAPSQENATSLAASTSSTPAPAPILTRDASTPSSSTSAAAPVDTSAAGPPREAEPDLPPPPPQKSKKLAQQKRRPPKPPKPTLPSPPRTRIFFPPPKTRPRKARGTPPIVHLLRLVRFGLGWARQSGTARKLGSALRSTAKGTLRLGSFMTRKTSGSTLRVTRAVACVGLELAILGPAGPFVTRSCWGMLAGVRTTLRCPHGPNLPWNLLAGARTAWGSVGLGTRLLWVCITHAWALGPAHDHALVVRAAAVMTQRDMTAEDVTAAKRLFSMMPSHDWAPPDDWLVSSALERVEWLNVTLSRMWPYVCKATEHALRRHVLPLVNQDLPSNITRIDFASFNLGTVAPAVASLRIVPADEDDELQIQLTFRWQGNPDIELAIYGGAIYGGSTPITVQLTDLVFTGTLQITLAQLFSGMPLVGGIQIMFVEEPYISYNVAVKALSGLPPLSLSSIPGLDDFIKNLIITAIHDNVLFPNAVPIVVATQQPPDVIERIEEALAVNPIGKLQVTLQAARDLTNVDFFDVSDPFAVLGIGFRSQSPPQHERKKTQVVENDLSPVWAETFEFDICSLELQSLWVRVMDRDEKSILSLDSPLGEVILPLDQFNPMETSAVQFGWYQLRAIASQMKGSTKKFREQKRGEIHIGMKFIPAEEQTGNFERMIEERETKLRQSMMPTRSTARQGIWHRLETAKSHVWSNIVHPRIEDTFTKKVKEYLGMPLWKTLADPGDQAQWTNVPDRKKREMARKMPDTLGVGGGLPAWAIFPKFERVAFLNHILNTVWPYASAAVEEELTILNEQVLPKVLPGCVQAQCWFHMGDVPPVLDSVRVEGGSRSNEVMLEFAVRIAGDQSVTGDVQLFRHPNWKVSIAMTGMQFMGTVRVHLRPLLPRAPLIAGLSVSILGEPLLDASFKVKMSRVLPTVDVMSLPGVSLLKKLVTGPIMQRTIRFPAALHVPILDFSNPAVKSLLREEDQTQEETHTLRVVIEGARHLSPSYSSNHAAQLVFGTGATPTTADPYVVMAFTGDKPFHQRSLRTKTVTNSLAPRWHEEFRIPAHPSETEVQLSFVVFDAHAQAAYSDSDPLGTASYSALSYSAGGATLGRGPSNPPSKGPSLKRASTITGASLGHAKNAVKLDRSAAKRTKSAIMRIPRDVLSQSEDAAAVYHERMCLDEIPWDPAFYSFFLATSEPDGSLYSNTKQAYLEIKRKQAADAAKLREESNVRKRATTLAALDEEETKEFLKKEKERAARREAVAFQKAMQHATSDLEHIVTAECADHEASILGAALVDLKDKIGPGRKFTEWVPLTAVPVSGRAGRYSEQQVAEVEISVQWAVQRMTSRRRPPAARKRQQQDGQEVPGTLVVKVLYCSQLAKPKGGYSASSMRPMVDLGIGTQQFRSSKGIGFDPTYFETFTFQNVDRFETLYVSVFEKSVFGRLNMGDVEIPLTTVVRNGHISESYPLQGVKSGDIMMNMSYYENDDDTLNPTDTSEIVQVSQSK